MIVNIIRNRIKRNLKTRTITDCDKYMVYPPLSQERWIYNNFEEGT